MAETTEEVPPLEQLAAEADRADIEEVALALAVALQAEWGRGVEEALIVAVRLSENGAPQSEILGSFRQRLGPQFARQSNPLTQVAVELFYEIGTREVGEPQSPMGEPSAEFGRRYTQFWIENHYDRFVQDRIRSVSEENFRQGLGAFRSGQSFAESRLGREFSKSQSYWELLSNATATRTRELAHIDEFERQGIEEVMVDAVIDVRTSDICRTLDGTRFSLGQLTEHRDEIISAEDPTDVTDRSPWLSAERIRSLEAQGPKALAEAGVVSPPFHGHCRSRLSVPL
jgi:hypothetical protein